MIKKCFNLLTVSLLAAIFILLRPIPPVSAGPLTQLKTGSLGIDSYFVKKGSNADILLIMVNAWEQSGKLNPNSFFYAEKMDGTNIGATVTSLSISESKSATGISYIASIKAFGYLYTNSGGVIPVNINMTASQPNGAESIIGEKSFEVNNITFTNANKSSEALLSEDELVPDFRYQPAGGLIAP